MAARVVCGWAKSPRRRGGHTSLVAAVAREVPKAWVCPREGRDPRLTLERAKTQRRKPRGLGFAREKAGTLGLPARRQGPERKQPRRLGFAREKAWTLGLPARRRLGLPARRQGPWVCPREGRDPTAARRAGAAPHGERSITETRAEKGCRFFVGAPGRRCCRGLAWPCPLKDGSCASGRPKRPERYFRRFGNCRPHAERILPPPRKLPPAPRERTSAAWETSAAPWTSSTERVLPPLRKLPPARRGPQARGAGQEACERRKRSGGEHAWACST